ncbi:D-glycero-beta-D-manno-heptose 1-phosphate adenylyltransferase [Rhizomonospora bruguierae]|uniref:D-glycero-beta-D-manno-heptose 1-phosphate adenylyltransferase n=1 Tax=Rhizomonospora bruguierae TaxID=1581705 RepID=UPI001BCC52CD|nr:D-glycero-beta-D-manno-heptose 1-phosphate adenylyltransferase [Micromonospora sp. NBRC 107566]
MASAEEADTIDAWAGREVLVVGDALLDGWRHAAPERLSREAPAPVLRPERQEWAAGGAANTAINLAALGARPLLVAPVGDDEAGQRLRDLVKAAGVRDGMVTVPGRATTVKSRVLVDGQVLLREDTGDRPLSHDLPLPAADTLVVCDYGLGAVSGTTRRHLVERRHRYRIRAVDAHDLRPWAALEPTLVTPSFAEAGALLGRLERHAEGPAAAVAEHADRLLAAARSDIVAVTLDADGEVVAAAGRGVVHRERSEPHPPGHAVGAGDAYLSAFTLALAVDAPLAVAAALAHRAAALTLAGPGTCVCARDDLLGAGPLLDADGLVRLVERRRAAGDRIVFTNGCFDVLHRGHVGYLEQAGRLGDLLVVAVNSDDSVCRLKGPDRPVNPIEDRTAVLAALSCVDAVVVFAADSPAELIEAVRPDVYVKGGDYPPELVPEAPLVRRLGGEVRTLGYVPDRSTSAIIDRIRAKATGDRDGAPGSHPAGVREPAPVEDPA